LKVSANVKIAMQCFENFGGGKCPKCPPLACAPGLMHLRVYQLLQLTLSNLWERQFNNSGLLIQLT